jgi:hypothetical protein
MQFFYGTNKVLGIGWVSRLDLDYGIQVLYLMDGMT